MATDCSILQVIVQTAAIVIGWIVVHKLSTARDLDKTRREMLARATDSLASDVTELLGNALKYHTSPRSTELELKIKMSLQDISARVSLLRELATNPVMMSKCRGAVISLKKSSTGDHFEDEHESPISESAPQVQTLTADALSLRQWLQALKIDQAKAQSG